MVILAYPEFSPELVCASKYCLNAVRPVCSSWRKKAATAKVSPVALGLSDPVAFRDKLFLMETAEGWRAGLLPSQELEGVGNFRVK